MQTLEKNPRRTSRPRHPRPKFRYDHKSPPPWFEATGPGVERRTLLKGAGGGLALGLVPGPGASSASEPSPERSRPHSSFSRGPTTEAQPAYGPPPEPPLKAYLNTDRVEEAITVHFFDTVLKMADKPHLDLFGRGAQLLSKSTVGAALDKANELFPYSHLGGALTLNLWLALSGAEQRKQVLKGLNDTRKIIQWLMLATEYSRTIQAPTEAFAQQILEEDRKIAEAANLDAAGKDVRILLDDRHDAIIDILAACPLSATATQEIGTFGQATIAKGKFELAQQVSRSLFALFDGMTVDDARALASRLGNKRILKLLASFPFDQPLTAEDVLALNAQLGRPRSDLEGRTPNQLLARASGTQTKDDELKKAVSELATRKSRTTRLHASGLLDLADSYIQDALVGLVNSQMDITQVWGDFAPVAASFLRYGGKETFRSLMTNQVFAFTTALTETFALASRLGVSPKRVFTGRTLKQASRFATFSFTNLLTGILGISAAAEHFPGSRAQRVLHQRDGGARFRSIQGQIWDDLKHAVDETALSGRVPRAARLLEGLVGSGELSSFRRQFLNLGGSARLIDDVEQRLAEQRESGGLNLRDEQRTLLTDIDLLVETIEGLEAGELGEDPASQALALERALSEVRELASQRNVFNYADWERVAGQAQAETTWMVLLQGLHMVGMIPTFGRLLMLLGDEPAWKRERTLIVSQALHSLIAAVADNGIGQLVHDGHLTRNMFLPMLARVWTGLKLEELKVDLDEGNTLDQFRNVSRAIAKRMRDDGAAMKHIEEMLDDAWEKFVWVKHMANEPAKSGGGENFLGNPSHFVAVPDRTEVKKVVNVRTTYEDLYKHPWHHLWRFASTWGDSRLLSPTLERKLFATNPLGTADDWELAA